MYIILYIGYSGTIFVQNLQCKIERSENFNVPKIKTSVKGLQKRGNSYHLRRMIKGLHIQVTIGKEEDLSLKDAEHQAIELIEQVKKQGQFAVDQYVLGKKEELPRLLSNERSTLKDVATDLIDHGKRYGTRKTRSKPWKNSTVNGWKAWLNSQRMEPLLDQPIATITSQNIADWYTVDLHKGKPSATDNAFRKLIRLCNYAIGESLLDHDPTIQMQKSERRVVTNKRTTRLDHTHGEIGRFANALINYTPPQDKTTNITIKHAIALALMTGRRIAEIRNMEWDWINLDQRLITIPAEAVDGSDFEGVKNRQAFVVPMSTFVQTLLRTRYELKDKLPEHLQHEASQRFVFFGKSGDKPIKDFRKYLAGVVAMAGVERLIPHDFRRTFGDIARVVRPDFLTVKEALGHSINDVTADYLSGLTLNEKRMLFQDVSDYVSRSMPLENLTVDGTRIPAFDGQQTLKDDNRTEVDNRAFNNHAVEVLMFDRIWREGWMDSDGLPMALEGNPYEYEEEAKGMTN